MRSRPLRKPSSVRLGGMAPEGGVWESCIARTLLPPRYRSGTQFPQSFPNIVILDHQAAREGPDRALDGTYMGIIHDRLDPGLGQDMGRVGQEHQVVGPQDFLHGLLSIKHRPEKVMAPSGQPVALGEGPKAPLLS